MVAITILVDSAMTSSGLLLPGDRVDLLVTFTMRGQFGGGKVIKTVLEFVEVFSVDERREIQTSKGEALAKTLTLLVDPDQAMLVKLAEDVGKLHLTMRSKEDVSPRVEDSDRFKPTDMSDFLGESDDEEQDEDKDEDEDTTGDKALENFLDVNNQPEPLPVAPLAVPVPEETVEVAPIPKWEIEIFAGGIRRVEEVDIPESERPVIEPKREAEEDSSGGNPLLNGIRNLFGGSKSKDEAGSKAQEAGQPEALPAVNDNQNIEDSVPVPAAQPAVN
jgi:pilus assembly protein CpaB